MGVPAVEKDSGLRGRPPQMNRGFGRVFAFDKRDANHMIRERLPDLSTDVRRKFWWANGWWGDTEGKPWAVEFAWRTAVCDGGGELDLQYGEFHRLCKEIESDGERTTVRAGAKVLQRLGMISEYQWAFDVQDLITTVLRIGPVVMGSNWYAAMNYPNAAGTVRVDGPKVDEHCFVVNGVDLDKQVFRIKNVWGRNWGRLGYGLISFFDMDQLIYEDGDCCYASLSKSSPADSEQEYPMGRTAAAEQSVQSGHRNPSNAMASVA